MFANPPPDAVIASSPVGSRSAPRRLRLCVIATIGKSIQVLYAGRLEHFVASGFDVTVVCASSELDPAIRARGVRLFVVPFTRAVTPWKDLRALWRLYRLLRAEPFDLVEVATPKGALLGSIAAKLARSPRVVHILHGLSYQGKHGLLGSVLRWSTRIPCRLAHVTYSVSASVRDEALKDGIARPGTIMVLGSGSANGIDVARFSPARRAEGPAVRQRFNIPPDAVVVGFVGRLTRDKGIEELAEAFRGVSDKSPSAVLLVVGDYEHRDRPSEEAIDFLSRCPQVRLAGWQEDVAPFFAAMDVLVLPTYREGLPTVLLEAAAMEIPTITTDATGARDALVPGVTGLQVPMRDAGSLGTAIATLIDDAAKRRRMGMAGRTWVTEQFEQRRVWELYARAYQELVPT